MPHLNFILFILPVWNEESVIGPNLEALIFARRDLDVPSKVVMADDSFTDRTAEITRHHGARVVSNWHRQISATRYAAARAAQGDFFIFVDADADRGFCVEANERGEGESPRI